MNQHLADLQAYLTTEAGAADDKDPESLLETLYFSYCENNTVSSQHIQSAFRHLTFTLRGRSFPESDQVCCIATALCAEYQRSAFISGIKTGAALMLELAAQQ